MSLRDIGTGTPEGAPNLGRDAGMMPVLIYSLLSTRKGPRSSRGIDCYTNVAGLSWHMKLFNIHFQ